MQFLDDKYIEPIALKNSVISDENIILLEQIEQWRSQGFALIDNLLPIELIDNAKVSK